MNQPARIFTVPQLVERGLQWGDLVVLLAVGVGALIAQATAAGTYPVLLAATLAMIGSVVTLNRLVWRRLYRVAEARYRLE